MGFSHGRRKAAAKKVKAKELKGVDPDIKYPAGSRYKAVPHAAVLGALTAAAKATGRPCVAAGVEVYDGGTVMVAKLRLAGDGESPRPVLTVASAHDGRQPVEAFFGYEYRTFATPYTHLFVTDETVLLKHTLKADPLEWAERTWAAFLTGAGDAPREAVEKWLADLDTKKMSDPAQFMLVSKLAQPRYTQAKWKLSPFLKADPKRLTEMIEARDNGNGAPGTQAAFVYRAAKLIDEDTTPLRGVYRRMALLRSDGVPKPPAGVYGEIGRGETH